MKSILSPDFRYVPSVSTDLKRTFARIRREQREAASAKDELAAKRKQESLADLRAVIDIFNARAK